MSSRNDCRIYVGNLPPDIRTKDVEDLFYRFGKVVFVDLKNRRGKLKTKTKNYSSQSYSSIIQVLLSPLSNLKIIVTHQMPLRLATTSTMTGIY